MSKYLVHAIVNSDINIDKILKILKDGYLYASAFFGVHRLYDKQLDYVYFSLFKDKNLYSNLLLIF